MSDKTGGSNARGLPVWKEGKFVEEPFDTSKRRRAIRYPSYFGDGYDESDAWISDNEDDDHVSPSKRKKKKRGRAASIRRKRSSRRKSSPLAETRLECPVVKVAHKEGKGEEDVIHIEGAEPAVVEYWCATPDPVIVYHDISPMAVDINEQFYPTDNDEEEEDEEMEQERGCDKEQITTPVDDKEEGESPYQTSGSDDDVVIIENEDDDEVIVLL